MLRAIPLVCVCVFVGQLQEGDGSEEEADWRHGRHTDHSVPGKSVTDSIASR